MSDISIGIDPLMQLLVKLYYTIGIWQNGSSSKLRQIIRTSIFSFCAFSYPISLAGGGLINDDLGDSIFLWTLGIVVAVIEFKAFYVFFKQDNILTLLRATCTHSIPKNERLLYRVNKTLNVFKKCCIAFIILSVALTLIIMILSSPLTSDKLPFNIWFPLDYKSSHVAHWVAHCFVFINELFVIIVALLSPITWYVMLNCAIKYYIIGYRYKNVDVSVNLDNQSVLGDRDIFETEMIKCIKMQILLEEYEVIQVLFDNDFSLKCSIAFVRNVDTIGSFFSALFFVQIGTSAFCICGSVYILAIVSFELSYA